MNTERSRGGGTNRFSFLRYELICVTEERPALRVAQDHPLDADVLELDGAATPIQPITPLKANEVGTPDLAGESTRIFEVGILCCNFDAVLRELVQWEEVEGWRGDYNLCNGEGGAQSIGLVHTYDMGRQAEAPVLGLSCASLRFATIFLRLSSEPFILRFPARV